MIYDILEVFKKEYERSEDEISQKLAFATLVCRVAIRNSDGDGFCIWKGL